MKYRGSDSGCFLHWLLRFFIRQAIRAINGCKHEMTAEEFTSMVFEKIDSDSNGELSMEEFLDEVQKDELLLGILTQSLDLYHIVGVIQSNSQPESQQEES
ncbi:GUC1A protein, partial [Polyodon spathula]|nr:GUC1A protein [Polyodon spathula]